MFSKNFKFLVLFAHHSSGQIAHEEQLLPRNIKVSLTSTKSVQSVRKLVLFFCMLPTVYCLGAAHYLPTHWQIILPATPSACFGKLIVNFATAVEN